MRLPIRFLLFFSVILGLFTFLPKQTFAQAVNSQSSINNNQSSDPLGTDSDVPTNLHNATQVIMLETMSGVLCQLTGMDYLHPDQKCLGLNAQTGKIGFVGNGGGMIGALGNMISATMTPPVSSGQYISYLKNNFGITKHAYAAGTDSTTVCSPEKGIGFCGLWPVVDLWIAMRNIVYLILILAFVVIGVGIMLRLHIDPQTVMSVQNQIPKIIIGIVAITFSFAIAGFLIDIMFVATYLFASVISSAVGGTNFNGVVMASSPFAAVSSAVGGISGVAGGASDAFAKIIKDTLNGTSNAFTGIPFLGDIVIAIIGLLAYLIIAIAVIIALIRLWVTLILAYLNIILDVVFAPFWILAGVVPGSPLSLGSWLRDLVANLSVFPMTVGFFLLANVFISEFQKGSSIDRFVPPLLGGVSSSTISALIGLGFILMLPQMLTTMKAALKTPKINFGPILGPLGGAAKGVISLPRRSIEGAERGLYAKQGKNKREQILRFFGNPIYGGAYRNLGGPERPEPTVTYKPHEGPPGPGAAAEEKDH